MKTAGIICEYNPFHLGHLRQLRLTRAQLGPDTRIVCVMSGNYVQRGLPAMWDKTARACAALACGADVVLELPVTCALRSAEGFARAGVEILDSLGCVEVLSFGAECGQAAPLMELAARIDTSEFQTALRRHLDLGLPYAAARQAALGDSTGLLRSPNNILGLEYCRAILQCGSALTPLAIPRQGDYHAVIPDLQQPSATAVRSLYPEGNWQPLLPPQAVSCFQNVPWYDRSFGERAMLARLRSLADEEWEACAHGSEGLWSKAMKAARREPTLEAVIQATKSKRYPRTRIDRLLLCAYLGISASMLAAPVPYVRILGASAQGRSLLRQMKDRDGLCLVNAGQTPPDPAYFRLECRAADLFTLFAAPDTPTPCRLEQTARIILPDM